MIPIPGVMNLDDEVTLKLKSYSMSLQPYMHMFWDITVKKTCRFSSKTGIDLVEHGEVGLGNYP